MKLIERLKAIEQFVLDHGPASEVKNHLDVLQEHLEKDDALLERIAEKDAEIAKSNAALVETTNELDRLQRPPLDAVAIKLLKHFAQLDCVFTLDEAREFLRSDKGEAHRLCDTLFFFDPPLIQQDSLPIDDQRYEGIGNGDLICYSVTPAGRERAKRWA